MMTSRERIIAVLNREKVDRIPVDFWYTEEVQNDLMAHFDVKEPLELFKRMGVDKIVAGGLFFQRKDETVAAGELPRSLYGAKLRQVRSGRALYTESVEYPLVDISSEQALDDYPWWPRIADFDFDKSLELFRKNHDAGFATYGLWNSFLENYTGMRGLENALFDLAVEPDQVDWVLDRIEDLQFQLLDRFLPMAQGVLDLVYVSDDMGSQTGPLISPAMWRRHFFPRMKRLCTRIHDHGMRVFYHSDGACEPMLDGLIEAGIDVLNPIQHCCPGMNPAELKRKYGAKVIFHGGVDTQQVMPFGSPADVRREVEMLLATLGAERSGYICASCHNLQAGTPVENILTMVETVLRA